MSENKLMSERIRYISLILWIIFSVFLFCQYQLIYLYFDDFGYCSLSYGYDAGISGTDISLYAMLKYIYHSRSAVNGRVFTNFLLVLSAYLGGLGFMRIFIPLCILTIYMLIYRSLSKQIVNEFDRICIVIFLIFSYGLFSINICCHGMYWFAAAYGYVIPTMLFLVFVKIFQRHEYKWILPILSFILCMSCEQAIAMTFVYIIGEFILIKNLKQKILPYHIVTFISSIVGSIIMISSPASQNRMLIYNDNQQSIFEKIINNGEIIVRIFINDTTVLFVFLVLILFFIIGLKLVFENKKNLLHYILLITTGFVITLFTYNKLKNINYDNKHLFFLLIYFVFAFAEVFFYYLKVDKEKAVLVASTMASIGLLLLVPEIPQRTFIPFVFMMIYFLCDNFSQYMMKYKNRGGWKALAVILLIPYIIINIKNLTMIYEGYQRNKDVLEYNNCQLIEARDKLNNQMNVEEVLLYKLPDSLYAGPQPYVGARYMKFWIDEYYSLPYEIEYIYCDYPTGENAILVCPAKEN